VFVTLLQERRSSTRKTLERLTYIDLLSSNGGIVTDLSEGGLGFHVVAPVQVSGPIDFCFTSDAKRIAGTGELAWTDEEKRTGGLRFVQISAEVREQIRRWPLESNLRLELSTDCEPDVQVADPSIPESTDQTDIDPAAGSHAPYFPEIPAPETRPGTRTPRLLKVIGVSGLAGVIGVVTYLCYREAREWLMESERSNAGEQTSEALTQASASDPPSGLAPVENLSAGKSKAGDEAAREVQQQPASAAPEAVRASDAIAPARKAPAPSQAVAAAPGMLFVQVAAYTDEPHARKLVETLREQHFDAFVRPPASDVYYRVQLGPYANQESARMTIGQLKRAGFEGFIRD
jgi:cell division septation protein DedD